MPFSNRVTLSATGNTQVTSAGALAGTNGYLLSFVGSSWTGSALLQQNIAPPGAAQNLVNVAYVTYATGAAVAAGTAITADNAVVVQNDDYDLYLVYTHTAGSVQVTVLPTAVVGSGAVGLVPAGDIQAGTFGGTTGAPNGAYLFGTGAFTVAGAASFTAAGTGLAVTNNVTVGGTLAVTGAATFYGVITVAAGQVLKIGNARVAGALAQGGSITLVDSTGAVVTVLTT